MHKCFAIEMGNVEGCLDCELKFNGRLPFGCPRKGENIMSTGTPCQYLTDQGPLAATVVSEPSGTLGPYANLLVWPDGTNSRNVIQPGTERKLFTEAQMANCSPVWMGTVRKGTLPGCWQRLPECPEATLEETTDNASDADAKDSDQ